MRTLPVAGVQTYLLCVCVYTHALSLNTQPSAKFYALSSVSTPGTVTTMLGSTSGVVDGLLVRSVPPIPSPAVWSPSTQLLARLESWLVGWLLVPAKLWSCPQITFAQFRFGSDTKLIDHAVLVRSTPRISLILLLVVGSQPNRKELEAARERN